MMHTGDGSFRPIGDEEHTNRVMMRQIQGYYHYNDSMGKVDVREIDANFAFNLYNWYLRKAKDEKQKEVMKKSRMLLKLEEIFTEGSTFK